MVMKFRAIEHNKNSSIKPIIDLLNCDSLAREIAKGTTIVCDGIFDELSGVHRITIKKLADNLKELTHDDTE